VTTQPNAPETDEGVMTLQADSGAALPAVAISARAARRLAGGFLWVYSNEIEGRDDQPEPAYWCRFIREGRTIATGYYNRHSLIAGRVVALSEVTSLKQLLEERLLQAIARRQPLERGRSARLVFSEADLLPGLVIDFYPPHAVIQSNTAGMDRLLPLLEERLAGIIAETLATPLEGLVLRCDARVRQLEAVGSFTRVALGEAAALSCAPVRENGVTYAADLVAGQKTGFFLDQRDNRLQFGALTRKIAAGRVLDLFCYSGGWGLRALTAGAAQVTFVDESRDALDLLERGLAANAIAPERAELHRADVFDFLARQRDLYDAVVADPPAFVKSRKNLPQAVKAYQKLCRLAWRRLKPGGVLFACSCSHHLSESDFGHLLAEAVAKEHGLAHLIYRGGPAPDHPVLLSMPETSYLKCLGVRKLQTS
jgi:23S rRNA (cytosine1962-C5)-methyltransferase